MKTEELKPSLRATVFEFFPEEVEAFDLFYDEYFAMASAEEPLANVKKRTPAATEFGDGVIEMLKTVAIIWSSVKMVRELVALWKNRQKDASAELLRDVTNKITQNLSAEGIDAKMARKLAKRLAPDIISIARGQ